MTIMTFYEVRAKPRDNISDLRYDIDHGMIHTLIPFGKSLQRSLENAKVDNNKNAIWIEEDSNDPPLVSEREAVLDRYFSDIQIVTIFPVRWRQPVNHHRSMNILRFAGRRR